MVSTSDLIKLKLKVEQKQTVFHPRGCTFSGGEPLNLYTIILEPTFGLLSDVLFLFLKVIYNRISLSIVSYISVFFSESDHLL